MEEEATADVVRAMLARALKALNATDPELRSKLLIVMAAIRLAIEDLEQISTPESVNQPRSYLA